MRSYLAAGLAAVLSVTLGSVVIDGPAQAATYVAPTAQKDWVTPSRVIAPTGSTASVLTRSLTQRSVASPAVPVWPKAGVTDLAVSFTPGNRATAAASAAAPVTVAAVGAAAPAKVKLRMLDRTQTDLAGVNGVLFGLSRADGVSAEEPVKVSLTYRDFAAAFGADWALRLRLVQVPACALTTPGAQQCRRIPLVTGNNAETKTLTAQVNVSGAETMLAAEGDTSSGAGDYGATSLQPSATWTAGSSTGEFNWNYPLRTPPGVGGPAPKLALAYSSAGVDGQMVASNNQPSWVGEGFEMWPGYIERRYKSCGDDMGNGGNNTDKTADLCWGTDNATLSLAGHAGELLKDPTVPNRWHLRADDGTYIQRRTGAGNGDNDGEWWVVTTTDGTQYWFGGKAANNSTLTVPVASNNTGEPGHVSSFEDSFHTQAWRWNLDHVVDQHGNTMSYFYTKETNKYAKQGLTDKPVGYDRGAFLNRIEYGTRTDSTGAAPVIVEFDDEDRCFTTSCTTHNGTNWKDVPWDLECKTSPCYVISPTFWTTRRLGSVTTKLWKGTASDYAPVTTYRFTHSTPDPGDGTRGGLVLDKISQTGYVRVETSVPDVTFAYVQLNNRVDPHLTPDHSPAMNWFRLAHVTSESGARIEVTYSPEDCVPGSRMPSLTALDQNNLRCYPVKWAPPGYQNPIWDFFHKYVVTEVHEVDTVTPEKATKVTKYQYANGPAWHYTDDDGLTKAQYKTWSVWRGYGTVYTRVGVGPAQTLTETRYFQGMHGDKTTGDPRDITLAAVDMNSDGDTTDAVDVPSQKDEDAYAGMPRETIVYNGENGAELSGQVMVPWQSEPTATRTINSVSVYARFTGNAEEHQRLIRDGGRTPRTTANRTTFDAFGLPVEFEDYGDQAVTGDEKCTLTDYARNADLNDGDEWLVSLVKRKRQFVVGCTRAKQGNLTKDDVVVDEKTYYDYATSIDTPPTRGLPTRQVQLEDWVSGAPVHMVVSATTQYDANGRPKVTTDSKGNTTTTDYFHNAGGQLVRQEMTNQLGWTEKVEMEPAFGVPLAKTDPNFRVTAYEYDGMGRLTSVWKPGRDKGVQSASEVYTYQVRNNAPTVVATAKLLPNGGYVTTYELHDGMLRPRQTQAPRGDGTAGVQVSDTFYDSAGRAWKAYDTYLVAGTPGPLLVVPNEQGDVPSRTETTFDGAGRSLTVVRYVRNSVTGVVAEHSRQVTAYGGDRVDVTPPTGGTASSTFTDQHGNTTALWHYFGPVATPAVPGSYEITKYEYTAKDQLKQVTDPDGNVWSYTYDLRGQRDSLTDPNTGTATMKYNKYGELESTTDPRGVKLVYTYDFLGRKTGMYKNDATVATNLLAEWKYDELLNTRGQKTSSIRYDANRNKYVSAVLGFTATYQPTGMKISVPTSETGLAGDYLYNFTYLADGSLETTQLPDIDGPTGMTAETLRSEYNGLGSPSALKTSLDGGTTYVAATGYTGYGELATTTLQYNGGSTVTLASEYADGTRLVSRKLTSRQTAPTNAVDLTYSYDPSGGIVRISEAVNGDHQCFRYDYLGRLSQAWTPADGNCGLDPTASTLGGPAKYWTSWEFDAAGNRKTQVENITPTGVKTSSYGYPDEPNRLKTLSVTDDTGTKNSTITYESGGYVKTRPNGTSGQTIEWDLEGHASKVDTTEYLYDADGNRLIRRDATGKTLYLPNQELRYTTNGGTKKCTRYYRFGATTVAMRTTGGVVWLSSDHQGTTAATIRATDQAVAIRRQDPFGNSRTGSGTWPASMDKGFVGGTKDNTGLTHLGAREYDPVTGRFMSPDPAIDSMNRAQLDPYNYAFQNPIGMSDPGGMEPYAPWQKKDWVWLGRYTMTMYTGGYKIVMNLDLYAACRNNGSECVFNYTDGGGGHTAWVNTALAWDWAKKGFNIKLKIFVDVSIYAYWQGDGKTMTVGPPVKPIVLRPPKVTQRANYCLPYDEPPEEPHCDFFGPCDDFHLWWKGNKNWVLGGITVAGVITCAFTAGAGCYLAEGIEATVGVADDVLDLGEHYRENGTNMYNDKAAVLRTLLAAGADYGTGKLPNVRTESGEFSLKGLAVQSAWNGLTGPGMPLEDVVDPYKWTFISGF
ncbi:MAG: transcriptional regulator [Hamadaea sp.]|nr:transcriptional regulator [Hamadaea sp.]